MGHAPCYRICGRVKGATVTDGEERIPEPSLPVAPGRIREAAALELVRVNDLVQGLTLAQWDLPSAAGDWTIGQVVTHLELALGLYARLLDAVLAGHGAGGAWRAFSRLTRAVAPVGGPAFNAVNSAIPRVMTRTLAPETLKGQFAGAARALRARLDRVTPGDDMRPVHYMGQAWPLSFFLANTVDELALHGWDIESRLTPAAQLSPDARAVLPWFFWGGSSFMLRPPSGTTGTVAATLADPEAEMWWTLGERPVPRVGHPERADARIHGEAGTFVLLLGGRLGIDQALRSTSIAIEGDEALGRLFLASWRIV